MSLAIVAWLEAEIERERQGLISIAGPSGQRNSQASALGLARNSVRQEVLERLRGEEQTGEDAPEATHLLMLIETLREPSDGDDIYIRGYLDRAEINRMRRAAGLRDLPRLPLPPGRAR